MARKGKKVDRAGYLSAGLIAPKTPDYVVVELRHDSHIAYSTRKCEAPAAYEKHADSLNRIFERFSLKSIRSHFGMSARGIRPRAVAAPTSLRGSVTSEFAQAGFVGVVPRKEKDCAKLVKQLAQNKHVWKAFVAPRPVPAAIATGSSIASRNFEPAQGYMHDPPNGIGAIGVWSNRGGDGRGVTVCDIEGNWNFRHEDLPRVRRLGGTLIDDIGWRNHGTAVLGEIVSKRGDRGTVGIAHRAKPAVHSAIIGGVFNTAQAITNATKKLRAGDVILIELQATGPNGKYVAMQYWEDTFSAIRAATAKGITVVEAAGNGDENFDLRVFRNTGLQKDSGAIVVGAGIPPTNYFDNSEAYASIGVPRSRIWFSNYGKILSVQGWGWHVTTLGYGDAQGGSSENRWYTLRFSGTSSASPIITGAVACIQGRSRAKRGTPMLPSAVRSLLIRTGTPQQPGPGVPLTQKIGPQPNLLKAIRLI